MKKSLELPVPFIGDGRSLFMSEAFDNPFVEDTNNKSLLEDHFVDVNKLMPDESDLFSGNADALKDVKELKQIDNLLTTAAHTKHKIFRGNKFAGKKNFLKHDTKGSYVFNVDRCFHKHNFITINTCEEFVALGRKGIGLFRTYMGLCCSKDFAGSVCPKKLKKLHLLSKQINQPVRQIKENIKTLIKLGYLTKINDNHYHVIGRNGMSVNRPAGSDKVLFNVNMLKTQKDAHTLLWLCLNGYIHEQYLNNKRILAVREFAPKHIKNATFFNETTGRWNSLFAKLRNAKIVPWQADGTHRHINSKTIIQDPQISSSNWKASILPRKASTHRGHIKRMDATKAMMHIVVQMLLVFQDEQERNAVAAIIAAAINAHNAPFEIRGKTYGEQMVYKGTCNYFIPKSFNPYSEQKFEEGFGYYLAFDIGTHVESNLVIKKGNLKPKYKLEQQRLFQDTFAGQECSSFRKTCNRYSIDVKRAKALLNKKVNALV